MNYQLSIMGQPIQEASPPKPIFANYALNQAILFASTQAADATCDADSRHAASESLHKNFKQDSRLFWLTIHLIGSRNTDRVLVYVGTVFQHTYRMLSKRYIMSSSLLPASSHVSA